MATPDPEQITHENIGISNALELESCPGQSPSPNPSVGAAAIFPADTEPTLTDPVTKLLHYQAALSQTFHCLWEELAVNYGPETAHNLRVNVKRQRAFFQSLEWLSPPFSARGAAQTYRALYRCAGQVRDCQVEQHWLSKYEHKLLLTTQLSAILARQEQHYTKRLRRYRQHHHLTPFTQQEICVTSTIQHLDPALLLPNLHHHLQQQLEHVTVAGQHVKVPEKQLHDLRKQLKTLGYNLDLWGSLSGTALLPDSVLRLLQDLQHHLGQWHDHDVLLLHGRKIGIPDGLRRVLREEATTLKHLCRQQLTDLINSVGMTPICPR
ncbi:MAG: hypothetical protein OHK0012_12300 [Synechococcales cyanobacterium]